MTFRSVRPLFVVIVVVSAGSALLGARLDGLRATGDRNFFFGIDALLLSGDGNTVSLLYGCGPLADCAAAYSLLDLPTMRFQDIELDSVFGLSRDGTFAVGSGFGPKGRGPAIWNFTGGQTIIGAPRSTSSYESHAAVVSADGTVAAGRIDETPFMWIQGQESGGRLDGVPRRDGGITGMSDDGSVLAGYLRVGRGTTAFRWTVDDQYQPLGFLDGGDLTWATSVSADGNVIVGYGTHRDGTTHGFRWTSETGLEDIGAFRPIDVSGDGGMIIGHQHLWNRGQGVRTLVEVLKTDHGVNAEADGWELSYATEISDDGKTILGQGALSQTYQSWILRFGDFERCDLNADGVCDAVDVDALTETSFDRILRTSFDLNGNREFDFEDRRQWVENAMSTFFGDANLDGEFNSSDLVAVFQAGEYEDAAEDNSGWAEGDWDGDGDFKSGDLVLAFQEGGYEQGPRNAENAVPEPTSFVILMAALIGVASVSRSRGKPV